ncbi:MAG: helix-turn-helix domain-containing protein [bacterium]|nr:helix-turn-helix domain-containing protein [bacterium]
MGAEKRQPLVSVERQYETDVATGNTLSRMFVKMYFAARDSGLLADIGDIRWRTLCCLATYMDADGQCRPSQARVARDLGIGRQQANKRIRSLAAYRFEGRPVLRVEKTRRMTSSGGRWGNNVYSIQPISGLGIFDDRKARKSGAARLPPVSTKGDTGNGPVSGMRDSRPADTNKSHSMNQTHTPKKVCAGPETEEFTQESVELVRRFHKARGHSATRHPTEREIEQADSLIAAHGVLTAEYILTFGLKRAQCTRFEMENFGAILQYVDDAIESKRQSASRRRQLALPKRRESFEEWQRDELARIRSNHDSGELSEIEEAVRNELLADLGTRDVVGFDLLVMSRVNQLLSARHELTRDEFRRRRATTRSNSSRRAAS